MAGLLSATANAGISADEINKAIAGKSPDEVYALAQQHGVSAQQLADATGGAGGYDINSINNYLANKAAPAPTPTPTAPTPTPTTPTPTPTPPRGAQGLAAGVVGGSNTGLLSATGNPDFSADDIRHAIGDTQRGDSPEQIAARNNQVYQLAQQHGVSAQQIADAMGGAQGFDVDSINGYVNSRQNNTDTSVLYGEGNPAITPDQIRAFVNREGVTEEQILAEAIRLGISAKQISDALAGNANFTPGKIDEYLRNRNIINPQQQQVDRQNFEDRFALPDQKEVDYGAYNPNPAEAAVATQDQTLGTVAGQLNKILDPNSLLMQQAQTFGDQQSNRRGILNSSIGISAAQNEMIRAGVPIATADAAANNQFSLANAQNQQQANLFNSDIERQYDLTKLGISKDMAINAENIARDYGLATIDVEHKLQLANIDAASKSSSDAAGLNDRLLSGINDIQGRDISQDAKDAQIKTLVDATDGAIAMLGAFDTIGASLNPRASDNPDDTGGAATPSASRGSLAEGNLLTQGGYELTEVNKNVAEGLRRQGVVFDEKKLVSGKEIEESGIPTGARNLVQNQAFAPLYVRP